MNLSEFDYHLPQNRIAQKPASPKDHSKLMVLDRQSGEISNHHFFEIKNFLKRGDIIVLNNSKVFPARLFGNKIETNTKAEILLIKPDQKNYKNLWIRNWIIIGKPNLRVGQKIRFSEKLIGEIKKDFGQEKIICFSKKGNELKKEVFKIGKTPTPPYIKSKTPEKKLQNLYQTIYAKNIGSVAAPTAGFHFTNRLIKKLKQKGVIFKFVTLHIGLGTFQPIRTNIIEEHRMLAEWAEINKKTCDFLNKSKKQRKRIISVGTTSTRTLEGFTQNNKLTSGQKPINIFIYPGYKFKFIDCLITNFHLPKSTPLLLACAFAKKELIFKSYQKAIKDNYRFYSFGDAMIII